MIRRALVASLLVAAATPVAASAATCSTTPSAGGDWPFYGATFDNHREQLAEKTIGTDNAGGLGVAWQTPMPDGGVIQSTPTVADGCVFTGTDLGQVYAFNADTGELVWERKLQGGGGSFAVGAGIIGAPAVANGLVYVAATAQGKSLEAALDETTGEIVWTQLIDADEGGGADSSPIPFGDGMLFQAYQGAEDSNHSNPGFAVLDASREGGGKILAHTKVLPAEDFAAGDRGGSIVDTPAYDPVGKLMYVGTGNPASPHANKRTDALLKIDVDPASPTFGQILDSGMGKRDSYPAPMDVDSPVCQTELQWPAGRFTCFQFDYNFLASPSLWNHSDGRQLFGGLQKAGVFTAVDTKTMDTVWEATLGAGCFACNLSSIAVGDDAIYVAVTGGNLYALDRDTGTPKWAFPATGATHYEGLTLANGVLYTLNDAAGALETFDADTGVPLGIHPFMQDTQEPMQDMGNSSGISVARNTVFVTAKNTSTSTLFALKPGASGGGGDGGGGGGGGLPEPPGGVPAGTQVLSGPGAANAGYLTPVALASKGGQLTYTNADIVRHDVVSDQAGLFSSALIALGESADVVGVDKLDAGQYAFHCSLHPGMKGTLIIQ